MSRKTAPMPAATDVPARESQLADLAAQAGLTPEQIRDIRTWLSQIWPEEEEPQQEDSRLGLGQSLDIGTLIASLSGGGKQDLGDRLKAKLVEMIAGQLGLDPERAKVLAELLLTTPGGKQRRRRRRTTSSVSKATGTGGTTSKSKATGTGGTTSKSKATGTGGTTSKAKTTGTGSETSKSKAKRTGGKTSQSPKSSKPSAGSDGSKGAEASRSDKAR